MTWSVELASLSQSTVAGRELAQDGLRLAAVLRHLQAHTHACVYVRTYVHTHTHTVEVDVSTDHHWWSYRSVVSVSMVSMTTTMTWQTAMRKMASCSDWSSTNISAERPLGRGASLWEYCSISALLRMGWARSTLHGHITLLKDLAPPMPHPDLHVQQYDSLASHHHVHPQRLVALGLEGLLGLDPEHERPEEKGRGTPTQQGGTRHKLTAAAVAPPLPSPSGASPAAGQNGHDSGLAHPLQA